MGSKTKVVRKVSRPEYFGMGFKARRLVLCLYILALVVSATIFWGNLLHGEATLPWRSRHLVSARDHPHSLPSCHIVNVSAFDKMLMTYIENDQMEREQRQHHIEKILQENAKRLAWSNKRLVILALRKALDPLRHIHEILLDILMTRANQSSYKAGTMRNLLPYVKRQMDWHYKTFIQNHPGTTPHPLHRYETCAVVGNSGVLRNSVRGPEIDRHEMVIRLNNAVNIYNKNKTFLEEHIGAKTTMVFMNSHILQSCLEKFRQCNCHPFGVEVPIMIYLCIPEHAIGVACCSFEHETPIFLTDGMFDAFVSRVATWYSLKHFLHSGKGNITHWEQAHRNEFHYSSGFQAVIAALALCEKVDLYGFGKLPNARHHFHSFQPREHFGHDFAGEYLFYKDLEANRIYEIPFLCEAGIYIPKVTIFQ